MDARSLQSRRPKFGWCGRQTLIADTFHLGGIQWHGPNCRARSAERLRTKFHVCTDISRTNVLSNCPVCVSHILIVLSRLPLAMYCPGRLDLSVFCRGIVLDISCERQRYAAAYRYASQFTYRAIGRHRSEHYDFYIVIVSSEFHLCLARRWIYASHGLWKI